MISSKRLACTKRRSKRSSRVIGTEGIARGEDRTIQAAGGTRASGCSALRPAPCRRGYSVAGGEERRAQAAPVAVRSRAGCIAVEYLQRAAEVLVARVQAADDHGRDAGGQRERRPLAESSTARQRVAGSRRCRSAAGRPPVRLLATDVLAADGHLEAFAAAALSVVRSRTSRLARLVVVAMARRIPAAASPSSRRATPGRSCSRRLDDRRVVLGLAPVQRGDPLVGAVVLQPLRAEPLRETGNSSLPPVTAAVRRTAVRPPPGQPRLGEGAVEGDPMTVALGLRQRAVDVEDDRVAAAHSADEIHLRFL